MCLNSNVLAFPQEFIRSIKGKHCYNRNTHVLKKFPFPSEFVANATMALTECEKYCSRNDICWGCSVKCEIYCQWNALSECGFFEDWSGLINGDVSQKPSKCFLNYLYIIEYI